MTVAVQKKLSVCCRKSTILDLFIDVTDVLQQCPLISSVSIIEQTPFRVRSEWFALFGNAPFSWIQVDTIDRKRSMVRSEAVSGDFTRFTMMWDISGRSDGTADISCRLECRLDNALIEKNCGEVIHADLHEFVNSIVSLRVHQAVDRTVEERVFQRIGMERSIGMMFNGQSIDVVVIDVSRGGIRFSPASGLRLLDWGDSLLWESCGVSAKVHIICDGSAGVCRGTFMPPLDEQQFSRLLMQWSGGRDGSGETVAFYDVIHAPASTGVRLTPRPHR